MAIEDSIPDELELQKIQKQDDHLIQQFCLLKEVGYIGRTHEKVSEGYFEPAYIFSDGECYSRKAIKSYLPKPEDFSNIYQFTRLFGFQYSPTEESQSKGKYSFRDVFGEKTDSYSAREIELSLIFTELINE